MFELVGHVDARDRPILPIRVSDKEDSFLFVIDTGFNRQVLTHQHQIDQLCYHVSDVRREVEFADRQRRELRVGRSRIHRFGRLLDIEVLIADGERSRAALPDEPIGLLGTGLISPHRLTIDFAARRVVISEQNGAT